MAISLTCLFRHPKSAAFHVGDFVKIRPQDVNNFCGVSIDILELPFWSVDLQTSFRIKLLISGELGAANQTS
jgi:hypothetical protein